MTRSETQSPITFSHEALEALRVMDTTDESVFVTGRAGTGKSTVLDWFRNHTNKKIVVLAPTGVAAVNVRGQTIHSFCKFGPDITLKKVKRFSADSDKYKLIKKLDAVVIDEISMVRADLMDCVDKFLRFNGGDPKLAFGGKQMIMIGDLYQLPPVVTSTDCKLFDTRYASPYFFDAYIFKTFTYRLIELEKVYRQNDEVFIGLLNSIRNNSATAEHLAALHPRHDSRFDHRKLDKLTICLTTTNDLAAAINSDRLAELKGPSRRYTAIISGAFERAQMPADLELDLKIGAQVMLLNNDFKNRWVNGTMGAVVGFDESAISVKLVTGKTIEVLNNTWEVFEYILNKKSNLIDSKALGSFTQYPLKLAWAVTIHKSQGKTFDRVAIDLGRGTFTHGQLYVALSRCRTLEGITLKQPLRKQHIFMDWRGGKFFTRFQYRESADAISTDDKTFMIREAVEGGSALAITYLKSNDEKSRRVIEPIEVGKMEYLGKTYLGVSAYCRTRQDTRVFRVDRILEMKMA